MEFGRRKELGRDFDLIEQFGGEVSSAVPSSQAFSELEANREYSLLQKNRKWISSATMLRSLKSTI